MKLAKQKRRGVTLIFVISLIVLFILLGTTFAIVSSNHLSSSRKNALREVYGDPPARSLEKVLHDLIRDTNNVNSPFRLHSLGTDKYGFGGFRASVGTVNTIEKSTNPGVASSAFLQINLTPATTQNFNFPLAIDTANDQIVAVRGGLDGSAAIVSRYAASYNGQELTFLSGDAKGITCTIVGYSVIQDEPLDPATTEIAFFIAIGKDESTVPFFSAPNVANANLVGQDFLINGKAFNGRGAGWVAPAAAAAPGYAVTELGAEAFVPNRVGDLTTDYWLTGIENGADGRIAGLNEAYDAIDYNNLFLGAVIPFRDRDADGIEDRNPGVDLNMDGVDDHLPYAWNDVRVIPSFHNPALVDAAVPGTYFRPNPGDPGVGPDFPAFPAIDPATGWFDWDVDNDGDGIRDSVWIDPGYPVQTDSSGKRYKILVAPMILDMDGRLNVNASGTLWQDENGYAAAVTGDPVGMANGNSTLTQLSRGRGMGAGEISLRPIFFDAIDPGQTRDDLVNSPETAPDYTKVLTGHAVLGLPGKYGVNDPASSPGITGANQLMIAKLMGHPTVMFGGSYASYSDPHGRFASGLDITGQLRYSRTTAAAEPLNLIYQMNLMGDGQGQIGNLAIDQPFSYAEMERLLRPYDVDSGSLASRLWNIHPVFNDDRVSVDAFNELTDVENRLDRAFQARRSVTTHSNDVPAMPLDVRQMLRARMETTLDPALVTAIQSVDATFTTADIIGQQASFILRSTDLLLNLPMDLNRPFGNGVDEHTENGVNVVDSILGENLGVIIDEHTIPDPVFPNYNTNSRQFVDESFLAEPIWQGAANFDGDNDGLTGDGVDFDAYLVRSIYARNLYTLALLSMPPKLPGSPGTGVVEQVLDFDGNGDPTTDAMGAATSFETEKVIAQWVANVVDFKDNDSIMSVIEFDLNPFNGWHTDNNPLTTSYTLGTQTINETANQRFVVVGSERPELLIWETFASHDRRTEDLDNDASGDFLPDDPTFDQRLKPMGTFMMELVNPWTDATVSPNELYRTNNGTYGVDLRATSPVGASPVWRVLVVKTDVGMDKDPDNPDGYPGNFGFDAATQLTNTDEIERSIYFVRPTDALPAAIGGVGPDHGVPFVTSEETWDRLRPIGHQQFAVVGSAGYKISDDEYVVPFGRRTDSDEMTDLLYDQTRRFSMTVGQSIQLNDRDNADAAQDGPVNNCVAIPIDIHHPSGQVRSFSVSEPTDGYLAAAGAAPTATSFNTTNPFGGGNIAIEDFVYTTPIDEPLDDDRTDLAPDNNVLRTEGTLARFRRVHLQRLANPLAPWHPVINPYRTIDSASCDLTVFNGIGRSDSAMEDEPTAVGTVSDGNVRFAAKQRGDVDRMNPPLASAQIWKQEPATVQTDIGADDPSLALDNHFFHFNIEIPTVPGTEQSLGTVNWDYDYVNNPKYVVAGGGTPTAWPFLNWNNRPFVNQYELMQVPRSHSSKLLEDHTIHTPAINEYEQLAPGMIVTGSSFNHLLPFFRSSAAASAPELHRIMDFVRVPSLYEGTEKWLSDTAGPLQGYDPTAGDPLIFNAPFNRLSAYREPGKINLNTIFQERVWDGLFGRIADPAQPYPATYADPAWVSGFDGPTFDEFVNNRRGYAGIGILADPPAGAGTHFANPYRGADTSNLVPPGIGITPDVERGITRGNDLGFPVDREPLYERNSVNIQDDTNRNSYMRYDSLQRLANLTTTRSNVYSIWITMGYFEIDPETGDLGQEVGSDSGKVRRHRMFSIVDRSIPFAFEPGKDHNIDKIIKVKRFIE